MIQCESKDSSLTRKTSGCHELFLLLDAQYSLRDMYSARDQVENQSWLEEIRTAAAALNLNTETQTVAEDLFLSQTPDNDRSKRVIAAASLYAGALITGSERSQSAVADAMSVTRLSVQKHWKGVLKTAGFQPPSW